MNNTKLSITKFKIKHLTFFNDFVCIFQPTEAEGNSKNEQHKVKHNEI